MNIESYRDILQQKLRDRLEHNPSYSLRSFAKDLKIYPSRLSEILNGKCGLSKHAAQAIATHLGLDKWEHEFFCCLVEAEHARSKSDRKIAEIKLRQFQKEEKRPIISEYFKVISDWYHFAILELCELDEFINDVGWISQSLNISIQEVEEALNRLEKVGMIEIIEGEIVSKEDYSTTTVDIPSSSLKKYHTQLLKRPKNLSSMIRWKKEKFQISFFHLISQNLLMQKKILPIFKMNLEKNIQ